MRLPDCPFFLFGCGPRRKLLYRAGALADALTGETVRRWDAGRERIHPSERRVELTTGGGRAVRIFEDEAGVWLDADGDRTGLAEAPVALPEFADRPHGALLRLLHHDLLVNIVPAGPVPNLFVYPRPWYRDAAMVCMCLARTGNLRLVQDWIMGLRDPFDENNRVREPDNLGQALYLISLVADASHPLVGRLLGAAAEFARGRHVAGITDGAEHPVYQTKWLKFGLRALGLDDPHEIPAVPDSYSCLFWMDYTDRHVPCDPFPERQTDLYPYLGVAEAHFHRRRIELPPSDRYPITWEGRGGQADYPRIVRVCPEYAERRICAPHTWHAAELFLYLLDGLP